MITGFFLAASILGLILVVASIVFCIFYLFKFNALKDWVNDLAGGEDIVEHRLSFSMLRPILATFVITGGCLAVAVLLPEMYWLIAAVPLLYWAVVLGIRGRKLGTRAAFCEMIYLAFATAAAIALVTIFFWLLLIYGAILLLGHLTSDSGSSGSSSSGNEDDGGNEPAAPASFTERWAARQAAPIRTTIPARAEVISITKAIYRPPLPC